MSTQKSQNAYNGDGPIERRSDGTYRAWVQDARACNALNTRFRKYPGTDFIAEGSEGIFEFKEQDLPFVEAMLLKYPNPGDVT